MDTLTELPMKLASALMSLAMILVMLGGGGGKPPAAAAQLAFPFLDALDREYAKATPHRSRAIARLVAARKVNP